jgi:tetratricopeptide (TPR) repeat protein
MIRSSLLAIAASLFVMAAPASATCTLGMIAELPVTMVGMQPLVPSKINGADVMFVADSGAFFSTISPASADRLHLRTALLHGFRLSGVGGSTDAYVTTVKTFTLAKSDIHGVDFVVGGSEISNSAIGLLGQNVLRLADVEYDLANGAIRLFKPSACDRADMAYWAKDKPYSTIAIDWGDMLHPHTIGTALLSGKRLRVMFDTGASDSVLSLRGARLGGIRTDGPGVKPGGFSGGIGRRPVQTWLTPVATFALGGEEIRNSQLRIGDIGDEADMLIGADFFLSHRVYVANSQHKLYFSYNGGPVFNLSARPAPEPGPTADPAPVAVEAAGAAPDAPTDADGFSRRGAAYAARHDYARALSDLTRACDLAPGEARYFQQRAQVRLALRQPFLAMADFDAALKLKPDDVASRAARAVLRLEGHDLPGAREDLDAAVQASPKQVQMRLELAELYSRADLFEPAIVQFGVWIDAHPDDSHLGQAMNGRCWARALLNRDLDKALSDCNAAVRLAPRQANPLDSRGLVHLRRNELDRAIADYDAALALAPKNAWSLYGRGVAKLKAGRAAEGQGDIAAAKAIAPHLPERAARFDLALPSGAAAATAAPPAKS